MRADTVLLVCCLTGAPLVAMAQAPDHAAVVAPIHAFFDAMQHADRSAMRATVLPEGGVTLMRDGRPVQLALGAFADRLRPGKAAIEERIHDPVVQIDRDLATVWAPYTFLENGRVHHCGIDAFQLVKLADGWKIAAIADNSRTDCAAP